MIYTLEGILGLKTDRFAVVEVAGVGLRVNLHGQALGKLPRVGTKIKLFTHFHVREDAFDLYGFLTEEELDLFELLISVSGVGPKSALSVLDVAERKEIEAAIKENRPDLLTRASGVGRKTAERIILELKGKVSARGSGATVQRMETDADLIEALTGMGYAREEARDALAKVSVSPAGPGQAASRDLSARLKEALRILSGRRRDVV
ncbi:MAG: Holliday junction branch migration protein RuvA [Candidatus Liptonbacteria bacterium]|nr:Holliday junction branch migration protein RuvA [Candidatus Liptonbacteria bacterium]